MAPSSKKKSLSPAALAKQAASPAALRAATGGKMSRAAFVTSMYAVLVVQLSITLGLMYYLRAREVVATRGRLLALSLVALVLVLVLSFAAEAMPKWVKLPLFTLLALVMGGLLHQLGARLKDSRVVDMSVLGTILLFVALSLFAVALAALNVNLGWAGKYLAAAGIALLVAGLTLLVYSLWNSSSDDPEANRELRQQLKPLLTALFVAIIVLMSIYIVYVTDLVLMGDYFGDFVDAAIDLYVAFVDILRSLLNLEALSEEM